MQWVREPLGDICRRGNGRIQTGPFGSQLHESDYSSEGTPVVMPADIADGKITVTRIARVAERHVERLKRHKLAKGDIVYGRRGDIGRQALVRDENVGWLCGTGCLKITLGNGPLSYEFLHRYLSTKAVVSWIEGQAVGATMPNLNTGILERVPVFYPEDKATQKKIAAILSAYDELIENNQRRIALLEKMAEELYREWFVRIRFPGYEQVKIIKGVPEGWDSEKAFAFFGVVKGKSYAAEELSENSEHMPFINLKSFNRGGGYREDGLKYYSGRHNPEQLVRQNDVVMAVTDMTQDRAIVGQVARMPNLGRRGAVISLDTVKLAPKKINNTFLYAYMRHSGFANYIREFANGANVLHLKPELITKQKIVIPPKELQEQFAPLVEPLYAQADKLEEANNKMVKIRAALLPRLLSGKLSVENLDILFPPGMAEEIETIHA